MYLKLSRPNFLSLRLVAAILIAVFSISSCTIKLSPSYDQNIVDNLSSASNEVYELLSQVGGGTTAANFNSREEKYNKIIGRFQSLVLHINARPMPSNSKISKAIEKANAGLSSRGIGTISVGTVAPSSSALAQVVKNLEAMKTDDKTSGLTTTEISAFKGFIDLYLDQAVTYEKFLNK